MLVDIIKCVYFTVTCHRQRSVNKAFKDLRKRLNACVSADSGHFEHIM